MIQRLGELWPHAQLAFWLVLAACGYFAVMAVRLTAAALTGTIPGPGSGVVGALLHVPALRVMAAAAVLWLFYFLLRLAYPPGMGFGDVKLAGVLGLYLGYLGWGHVFAGTFAAFLFGGLWSIGRR